MSDDCGRAEDQPAQASTVSPEGYVYVATNPAMPNMVKIGRTTQSDPQTRVSRLFTTSVPVPFELEYAAAVAGDPIEVERALHDAFAPDRVHPKREFFKIKVEQVTAILRILDVADITEKARSDAEAEISQEDRDALERVKRRPILNFHELGIPNGSILTFAQDPRVKVEVVDARRVKLAELPDGDYPSVVPGDEPKHLSPLSRDLLGKVHNVPPTGYWEVEGGLSLLEIYDEKHGPRE